MPHHAIELANRLVDYLEAVPLTPEGLRLFGLAEQLIRDYVRDEPPFDSDCHPQCCTPHEPCCPRRGQSSGYGHFPRPFICPAGCHCHD